jgi:hypothetical protein
MASPARIAANRSNAQRSTGPTTVEGKARSSVNAVKHGLRARRPLLLDEDPAEYEALAAALMEQFAPEPGVEELLVDEIVGLVWRLWRAARVEVALFTIALPAPVLEALARSGETRAAAGAAFAAQATSFATLSKYEASLAGRLRRALADLERIQSARQVDRPGLTVIDGDRAGGRR